MARAKSILATLFSTAALIVSFKAPALAQNSDADKVAKGIEINAAQCAAIRSTVFVEVEGKGTCIRYYLSNAGGNGPKPLVYLSGDAPSTVRWGAGRIQLEVEKDYEAPTAEDLELFANLISSRAKTPAIFLARLGLDGSSGWHAHRRTYFEVAVTTKALDLIKERHKFEGYHIVGQSGGGHLIGALLANRTDIGCAVPGAGLLMTDEVQLPGDRIPEKLAKIYNPAAQVLRIARLTETRIIVLTDGSDTVVPIEKQIGFVRRLKALGGKAKQIFVRAFDEEHHQLRRYAIEAAALCIAGKSDAEIELAMFKLAAKLMAEKVAEMNAQSPLPSAGRISGVNGSSSERK